MKELSIEEKARAYDEALKKAKQFHNKDLFAECNGNLVEYIFPELAESEDERIRKELIAEVKYQIEYIPAPDCRDKEDEKTLKQLNSWLAWLEKQDDKDTFIKEELECIKGYREEAIRRLHELEKQVEQKPQRMVSAEAKEALYDKPKWSEEDERMLKEIISDVKFGGYNNDMQANSYKKINFLKSLKQRMEEKQ